MGELLNQREIVWRVQLVGQNFLCFESRLSRDISIFKDHHSFLDEQNAVSPSKAIVGGYVYYP